MIQDVIKKSNTSAVLIVRPDYYMSADARSFNIDTDITLYPADPLLIKISNKEHSDVEDNIIYRNKLRFTYFLPPEIGTAETKGLILHEWAKGNSKQVKLALHTGIVETAKMLAFDLSKIASNSKLKNNSGVVDIVLKSKNEYELVRAKDGSLLTSYN